MKPYVPNHDRDYYVSSEKISQDAIKEAAHRNLTEHPDAFIVIHYHPYESVDGVIPPCNEVCYRVEAIKDEDNEPAM